ncbi:MAG: Gfo/Idh/MocA family oxidoreductase [Candidatus Latescibacteria bacterium]|nr:Gfo/Idh/MocA family oxidoreductase [Candidatus Latescibacterota bacterium]
MSLIKIGLIGYGSWTRGAYLPALQRDGRGVVVSVAAPSESTRNRIKDDLGPDVSVFENFGKLLAGPKIDAVFIAVPDYSHESTLTAALGSGLPVLYEPPVSNKRNNIQPMLRRLLDAPQITHADTELIYIPVVGRAAELIKNHTLGNMQTANIRLQSSWGPKPGFEISNINHMSTWYVNIFNHILGSNPNRVLMFDGHGVSGHRQSHSAAYYDYNGVWGHIKANIACIGELDMRVELNGDDGDMLINMVTGELRIRTRHNPKWTTESWPALQPYAGLPGMHESVSAFLDAVESGKPTDADAIHIAKLHLIGLAADTSRDNGTWAEIYDIESI